MGFAERPAVGGDQPKLRMFAHASNVVDLGCPLPAAGFAAPRTGAKKYGPEFLPFQIITALIFAWPCFVEGRLALPLARPWLGSVNAQVTCDA